MLNDQNGIFFSCLRLFYFCHLGDVGFDDREILRDASGIDDSLYTNRSSIRPVEPDEKTLNEHTSEKPMDVDLNPAVDTDDFGGPVDGGFMGV